MVSASSQYEEWNDLDCQVSYRETQGPRVTHDRPSKARFNTQSRYARSKSKTPMGGAHRRRVKR